MKEITLQKIIKIKVGHCQSEKAGTGCTVILSEEGMTAGVDVRGGAPASRETELLDPVNLVNEIHGLVLSGGSAFGLDAASGVMKYLEEKKVGFDVGVTQVPIVCGASLFDLNIGDHKVRPNEEMGYKACENALIGNNQEGNIGAGTGATVGKILGNETAMKGGLGIYGLQVGDLKVVSIVAVNCLGDVLNPETGEPIAGLLNNEKTNIQGTEKYMYDNYNKIGNIFAGNTTIGAVITNGKITKAQATKIASMSHNGFARAMSPAHSMFDGDTIYTLATGEVEADVSVIGQLGANTMARAVMRGAMNAQSAYGIISANELKMKV